MTAPESDTGRTLASESPRDLLERSRLLFRALGDERGVHLCEIALAREASDPAEVLGALLPPIERLAATRTLTGLDVIASEALIAARALAARDIEARVRRLVVEAGSMDLRARVFTALWDRVEALVEAGDIEAALNAGWAALDLAVALDDFQAAAVSLVRIAGCHEAAASAGDSPPHAEAAALCLEQAARTLERAGGLREAGDLFLDAARHPGAGSRSEALRDLALQAYENAGVRDRAAECRIEIARGHLDSGHPREAIRTLQRALAAFEGPHTLATEVRVWEMLADAHRRLGDIEAATGAETRARLLGGGVDSQDLGAPTR